jgi:hypothetical protein
VSFDEAATGTTPDINLLREPLRIAPLTYGAFAPGPTDQNGHIQTASILFTNRQQARWTQELYYKVTLHEVGHGLGLDHTSQNTKHGTSVMNRLSPNGDAEHSLPLDVTVCDFQMAKKYSTR